MGRMVIKVTQYAFVHDNGDTGVFATVEDEKNNDTFRREVRYSAEPLYDCALSHWLELREMIIGVAEPWKLRLNCNILGVLEWKRQKDGSYKGEVLVDRHTHDSRLTVKMRDAILTACNEAVAKQTDEEE